ncbi:hypothetical protein G5B38_05695 [Pseudohalocynthiibacter aestuariivivens]|nr:hypothetical protein [Pseudohalocynthiibacter aestuariivivens]QIE45065.1 hypothetical protein G5B38_05695 [Pseudohalocynthiibacter aestuariivivens]
MLALLLCATPILVMAAEHGAAPTARSTGLMWNRTGLPAVFPLQVKTPAGQDYFLTLVDDETGKDALAAYIEGGDFFKVLVPPGVFRLRFAAGDVWQGEENLFGPDARTRIFELNKPLTFRVRGLGTKMGHVVNILELEAGQAVQAAVKDQNICQSLRVEYPSLTYRTLQQEMDRQTSRRGPIRTLAEQRKYLNDHLSGKAPDGQSNSFYIEGPQYELWSQFCD